MSVTDDILKKSELFIDPNLESADGTSAIGSEAGMQFSEDGKFLAYEVKKAGSDWATIRVKNAETK